MKKHLNDILEEQKKGWLKEDLVRILEKTRQEPGLAISEIALVIKETLGDDAENLMNQIELLIIK
jgi:hypothetical protein